MAAKHCLSAQCIVVDIVPLNIHCRLINKRCALVFISIIIDLHLITLIWAKLLSISSYITIKMYFFIVHVFSDVALRAAKSVKRDTVQFVFGKKSNFPHPPTFLFLKLFIRCLRVGLEKGWVEISLAYKWKQIDVLFRRIVYVYELFST